VRVHSFAVELTAECNQRCHYCYNREQLSAAAAPSSRQAQALLLRRLRRLLDTFDVDHVTLTGGEPFAQPALWEVLELCTQRCVPVQIISNGGLITGELARRLVPHQVRCVQITLNGPDAELHAEHTGERAHFDRAIRGIRALAEVGVPVVGCVVLTRLNARRVADILELWRSLGVADVALSRFSPAGKAVGQAPRLLPTRGDMVEALRQALPFARDVGMRLTCTMPIPPCMVDTSELSPIGFGSCAIGTHKQEFALGPDGRLRHCTLHPKAIGDGRDVADPELDLARLIRSDDVTCYRAEFPSFCEGCLHAQGCGGGCGAAAEWVLGAGAEGRRNADPFLWQHMDDDLAARLGRTNDSYEDDPE